MVGITLEVYGEYLAYALIFLIFTFWSRNRKYFKLLKEKKFVPTGLANTVIKENALSALVLIVFLFIFYSVLAKNFVDVLILLIPIIVIYGILFLFIYVSILQKERKPKVPVTKIITGIIAVFLVIGAMYYLSQVYKSTRATFTNGQPEFSRDGNKYCMNLNIKNTDVLMRDTVFILDCSFTTSKGIVTAETKHLIISGKEKEFVCCATMPLDEEPQVSFVITPSFEHPLF